MSKSISTFELTARSVGDNLLKEIKRYCLRKITIPLDISVKITMCEESMEVRAATIIEDYAIIHEYNESLDEYLCRVYEYIDDYPFISSINKFGIQKAIDRCGPKTLEIYSKYSL
jgi:hypothetical protein